MAKQAAECIAFHLGWDIADVKDGRYQRTSNPTVYVCAEHYYIAPAGSQKMPTEFGKWTCVGVSYGRRVYMANGFGK